MGSWRFSVATLAVVLAVAFTACSDTPTEPQTQATFKKDAGTGNGLPTGTHYTLHIHGADVDQNDRGVPSDNGQNMWVALYGQTKILLWEGDDFDVLDPDGLDGEASFQLPNPDPGNTGSTTYTVYAIGRGPGSASMTTCGVDPDGNEVCSTGSVLTIDNKGKDWQNAVRELLYLWDITVCDNVGCTSTTHYNRIPLFDDALEGYFWNYDNNGLRLATLRFYMCSTTVGDTYGDGYNDLACFQ